ncbi:MAG: class I tRNA ligase family protein, partial [Oscillospiraceae bacterium]|nr:class I tRNA ligase family protein [Oscillospiraceae bacterium]
GDMKALLTMLSPFAPHMCEELWEMMGFGGEVCRQSWPEYDESKTIASTVEMAVQIQGKLRGTIVVALDSEQDAVLEAAKANERVAKSLEGMQIVKVILVKNKLVNLIVKPL